MLFSYRKGLKKIKSEIQKEKIDLDLRNNLWNALCIFYLDNIKGEWLSDVKDMEIIFKRMWIHHHKKPLDTIKEWGNDLYQDIRNSFF